MIEARALYKSFGEFKAVDGVDFSVRKGECFGLLGPNGAGKSTFIGMTYGTVERTGGSLSVFGHDPALNSRDIKRRMGVVTQDNALDEALSVFENMELYCSFVGVPKKDRHRRISELLEYMNLSHKKDAPILSLSGGMKRRLVFVRALLGKPELLILDEPTTGLDPAVRHLLWGKVQELKAQGTTILLTTHYMHEAEVLCDRLVIMNHGKVVAEGSPQAMIEKETPGYVGIFDAKDKEKLQKILASTEHHFHQDSSGIFVRAKSIALFTDLPSQHGIVPLQIRPANLEDVFLKLTGQELSSDA